MTTTFDVSQVTNNYPNPLDDFVSHSYHFILSVANTTTAFEGMIGVNGTTPYLSKVLDAKHPGAEITLQNGEKAWVICDTRRFSAYQITDLQMEHIYGTGSPQNPTVPANVTSMSLTDSTGMSFFNMLIDLFRNKIKSTRASCFFMLSIVFTGHDANGATRTISTCNIPLLLLSMEFSLDHKGSIFELMMMETEGGISNGHSMDILNSLGDCQSIKGPPKVGGMIQALETQLNTKSVDFYRSYTNDAMARGGSNDSLGKLVQYMITVPKDWEEYECTTAARADYEEQLHLAVAAEEITQEQADQQIQARSEDLTIVSSPSETQMSFSSTTSITDAIKLILESSVDVLKLAGEQRRIDGKCEVFKTIVNVTSDTSTYVVHIDIFPYKYPKLDEPDVNPRGAQGAEGGTQLQPDTSNIVSNSTIVRNLMTYNYMFTGKNSHILDLKIKYLPASAIALDMTVDIGQNRFASNAAHGQTRQGALDAAEDGKKTRTTSFSPDIRPGDPIFFPPKSKDQAQNANSQHVESIPKDQALATFKAKQEYTQSMATMHFLSSLNMNVVIRGNPNLLMKYADRGARGGMAPHPAFVGPSEIDKIKSAVSTPNSSIFSQVVEQRIGDAKKQYILDYITPRVSRTVNASSDGDPLLSGPDVSVEPVFCKLNILAPNIDYVTGDFSTATDPTTGKQESPYTDKFFYNGAYLVLMMRTSFENGTFTHDLSMIPYDISGTGDILGQNPTAPSNSG
jgi:hypothetical protein